MKTNHSQWKKIRSSKSTNPVPNMLNGGSRCDSESTKITCFVSRSMQFPMLFYAVSTVFYAVFFRSFFWKSASRGSWRSPPWSEKKYVHPELHRGLCLWFEYIWVLKYSRIMESIQSTIASFQIMLNPFDCHKTTWPLSVTLYIQIQLIILFLGTKVHQHQKMLENNFLY
jgi:hypothetical protein